MDIRTSNSKLKKIPQAPEGTQAVIRAIRLLKTIARGNRPASLDELSRAMNLPKSTTHRILSALISERMIRQDPESRGFVTGYESMALGASAFRQYDLRSLARPVLEKLVALTGETATLEIPVQTEMLILDEILGPRLVGARAEIGTRWPIYATSSGKITLSTWSEGEIDDYLEEPRESLTKATLVSSSELLGELAMARKNAFALCIGELQSTYSAVSAAIRDPHGRAVAALSVGGPIDRLDKQTLERLGPVLAAEARQLEHPAAMVSGK